MQRFDNETTNENGEHDMKYKFTWQSTKRQQSVLDGITTNREVAPEAI